MAYLDEAIFGIEDVLNFTAELTTMSNIEILKVAISTLFDRNLESEVKTKLSGLTDLRIEVECIENKAETGSLQKRKIIDHRGENA